MLKFLRSFFGPARTHDTPAQIPTQTAAEPEKAVPVVQTPSEPARCGCGRSISGFCVGLHKLTAEEWAAHPNNPVKPAVEPTVKRPTAKKPAAKKPAAKTEAKPAAKKPAAIKAAPKSQTRRPVK